MLAAAAKLLTTKDLTRTKKGIPYFMLHDMGHSHYPTKYLNTEERLSSGE